MQIASLIANDRFMSRNNLTAPTEDFIDRMTDFPSFWNEYQPRFQKPHVIQMFFYWNNQHFTDWTRVLAKTGFCSTFNYPNVSQVFYQDR
jgi:hypothetical protein